jgi:hypothetical protein
MDDIETKALALVNEVREERHYPLWMGISRECPTAFEVEALCRALEQHEAIKQEVSDSWHTMETAPKDGSEIDVWVYINHIDAAPWEGRITACWWGCVDDFGPCWNSGNEPLPFLCKTNFLRWRHPPKPPLIIPKPKPKPRYDPLVDVAESLGYFNTAAQVWAGDVRDALEDLGFEIREKGQ